MIGPGLFGDMFDFNRDGKLDWFEEATEMQFYSQMMEDAKKKDEDDFSGDDDDDDDGDSDGDSDSW